MTKHDKQWQNINIAKQELQKKKTIKKKKTIQQPREFAGKIFTTRIPAAVSSRVTSILEMDVETFTSLNSSTPKHCFTPSDPNRVTHNSEFLSDPYRGYMGFL